MRYFVALTERIVTKTNGEQNRTYDENDKEACAQ